ncbi:FUN14 family-domain-containing protein [Chytridium lagenaria]|nr:FUN14 family-domain-containing protein [Chytridium lagenaria]
MPAPDKTNLTELADSLAKEVSSLQTGLTPKFDNSPAGLGEISMATVFGGAAGFAAKKITKTGAIVLGVSFMSLQALAHADIIKINWPRIEKLVVGEVDLDKDGKFTHNDVKIGAMRLIHNLTMDLPSAGGFAAAFLVGFRYG